MKRIIFKELITIMVIMFQITLAYSQFVVVNTPPTNYLTTDPITRNVGIGNFTAPPLSALHINTNLFPLGFQTGNVFRTDGPSTSDNIWEMWTGTTPKATLFNPAGSDNFVLHSNQGNMIFATTGFEHLRIAAGTIPTIVNPSLGSIIRTDNLDNFTISNWANTTGSGAFNPWTVFRVIGYGPNDGAGNVLEVAEFRGNDNDGQEIAIKIRGQRHQLTSLHIPPGNSASIELSNWDNDESVDYIMAKIAAGMQVSSGQTGVLSFWTNEGIANNGLLERMRINDIGNVGINTTTPHSALEINSYLGNPQPSGLRFTNLTSAGPYGSANGYSLTVDANGDVVLAQNMSNFGLSCSDASNGLYWNLTDDWRIGLGNNFHGYNIYFADATVSPPTSFKNSIGIGYVCGQTLNGKLSVIQKAVNNNWSYAGYFENNADFSSISPSIAVGVLGYSNNNHASLNIGIAGVSRSDERQSIRIGVYGEAGAPFTNPANPANTNWAGAFNGNIVAYDALFNSSDSILKKDVKRIDNSLSIIRNLKPVSFLFDTAYTNTKGLNFSGDTNFGFIAQDVEKILPELVKVTTKPPQFDSLGNVIYPAYTFKALNYNGFIGILTQGIKDLDSISDNQASRIDTLEVYGRGDYDWLLSGSNAQLRNPSDIDEIKYTNGYLQVNRNSTTPSAVFDVRNDTSIAHFADTIGAGMFATDATGFNIPAYSTFSNLTSNIYNLPNVSANIVGINSRITSNTGNNSTSILSEIDGPGSSNTAINGIAQGASNNMGVLGGAKTTDENSMGYGVMGYSTTESTYSCPWSFNMGVSGSASGGFYNVGGEFFSGGVDWNCSNTTGMNIGVLCQASNASYNYGIWASAPIIAGHQHSSVAGYFNGNVDYTGTLAHVSDMKFKQNIINLPNATSIIEQLQPRTYTYKIADYPYIHFDQGKQYGFVAQEISSIVPELVSSSVFRAEYDSDQHMIHDTVGYKSVNYIGLIPIMVQAMKETNHKTDSLTHSFNTKIDSLKQIINNYENRFNNLEQMINACCLSHTNKTMQNPSDGHTTEIELENIQAIVLDQNVPNPFAESTVINYFIPENINFAQMIFTDNYGRIMKTVDITVSGNGTIKVYASNLSSGIYTYSLVVDGKVVETKKMMRTK
jgi:hypothetical protein